MAAPQPGLQKAKRFRPGGFGLPVAVAAWGLLLVGCSTPVLKPQAEKRLFTAARMSPDAVGLDIFFIPIPSSNDELYNAAWQEVDEQVVPPELRRRLHENGFRVGVVGVQLPRVLQELLARRGQLAGQSALQRPQGPQPVDDVPRVSLRHLQLRRARRSELVASGVFEQLPVLLKDHQGVLGGTYSQCQGVFALRCFPRSETEATVQLVPELHYGQARQVFSGEDGAWRVETRRPRQRYDWLAVEVKLQLGQMLVLGAALDRPGTLGYHFFDMPKTSPPMRRLLLVRLAALQPDPLYDPPEPTAKDEAAP